MSSCEDEMFDLSGAKINEKFLNDFEIIDSRFAFNAEENYRELVLSCTSMDAEKLNRIDERYDHLIFTFNINENTFCVETGFLQLYGPIILENRSVDFHFYINKIYREHVPSGLFQFKIFNISKLITSQIYKSSKSRLSIVVNSNNWDLLNFKYNEKYLRNTYYINGILSLQAELPYKEAKKGANYICMMLSFISQKDVKCFESYDENGLLVETFHNKAEPYGGNDEIITISSQASPAELIELGYIEYMKDPKWWFATLEYFVEASSARSLETKIMLHCMQLERLMNKFLYPMPAVIDENLDKKKKEIVNRVSTVLGEILNNWNGERSSAVFSTIKHWNTRLSLKKGVKIFADKYGIPYLSESIAEIRGNIAHNGIITDGGNAYSFSVKLYEELKLFIIISILKIFKYNGYFTCLYFSKDLPAFKSVDSFKVGTDLSKYCERTV